MKEDKKYKNKPTIKEPTVEEQLAAYTAPLPTVSSPYKTQNVANMKNYIGEQTPQATPFGAYTPAPVTTPSTKTDYSRNANQNRNTPTSETQDEFSKWYVDQQTKQDEINNEVVETIKKWYSSKTEQEKSFYEQQLGMLQSQYEQNQQMLDQAKSQDRREADILHSRMMKYLPEQMNAQGLRGLGISQSVLANAQNSLSSRLGNINQYYTQQAQMGNSEYLQNQMDLMQNYLSNQSKTDQEHEGALLDQYMRYSDRTSALGSQQREERLLQEQYAREEAQNIRDTLIQPNMQSLMEFNADGTITEESYNNLMAYIDNLDLPNNLKTALYTELDLYKKAPPQNIGEKVNITFEEDGNKLGSFKPKDTFHVTANGKDYKLNSAGIVDDATIKAVANNYKMHDLFVYGDKLYLKHEKGIVEVDTNRDYKDLIDIIYPKK